MAIQFPDDEGKELEVGQQVPEDLKSLCKKNEYGKYSLRFNKFFYIANSDYKVEEKAPDTLSYDPFERVQQSSYRNIRPPEDKKDMMDSLPELQEIELNEENNIVDNIVEIFAAALEKYSIATGDFKNTYLGKGNRGLLRKAYMGDLSYLASGIKENNGIEETIILKENGLSLLKALLIHEFFSVPALKSYDDNRILSFISHIIALEADGLENAFIDIMNFNQQQEMMFFFKELSRIYKDKTNMINQIQNQVGTSFFQEYSAVQKTDNNILFRAFFISKIFTLTSKSDRGNKITMIRLLKEILDFE